MSSSLAFIAYAFDEHQDTEVTGARVLASQEHLKPLYQASLSRTWAGSGTTGFVGWHPDDAQEHWSPYTVGDGQGTAWLHIPSCAGGPESPISEEGFCNEL